MKSTPWTITVSLRIAVQNGKRTLQQRYTRVTEQNGQNSIEEKWEPVPVVEVENIPTPGLTKPSTTIK